MSATSILNIETAIGYVSGLGQSATVSLGDVTLTGMEVGDALRVGGNQALIVHKLPGGDRIIDSAGNDPDRLSMMGRFTGPNALTRARAIEAMRKQGTVQKFTAIGYSWNVKIRSFWYEYRLKGAIIPYGIELELEAETTASASNISSLSSLIGSDAASALTGVTTAISDASSFVSTVTATAQTIVGEVTPIANIIGVGGPLATAQNYLTAAQTAASAGGNIASLPSSLSSMVGNLEGAATNLSISITQTGANLSSLTMSNSAGLLTAMQNAELHSASVDSGALVNRSYLNTLSSAGQTTTEPLING